ncbi:dynamin family protein [Pseudoalteromonas sp. B160]|uniref:dynamin family protein n=1 Tax=Pseudoalteromonas sp. B160 TaxID=630414 RepID=UPI00301E037F
MMYNKNSIITASKDATLQIIEQMGAISKEINLEIKEKDFFDQALLAVKNSTEKLNLILSVVGVMKAGKSTLINSIVGNQILPSRSTPMTALPTYIKHNASCSGVVYRFKHADLFSKMLADLHDKKYVHTHESSAFTKRLANKNLKLDEYLNSLSDIHEQLEIINDICRINIANKIDPKAILETFRLDEDFPTIETCFQSIKELKLEGEVGNFILVDTPGANEAKLPELKSIVDKQIKRSSALLLVLNYTDLSSDADSQMRSKIVEEAKDYQDRLIVAVNRFDARDKKSMNKNETIRYVKEELLEDIVLNEENIFPVSARNALLGGQSLNWLERQGKFELATLQDWQRDFLDNTTSGEWDEEDEDDLETIENIEETTRHAKKLLKSSRIADFINTALNRAYQNTGPDTIIAALGKLNRLLDEKLKLTLEADLDSACKTISELKIRVVSLENALINLASLSNVINKKLNEWAEGASDNVFEYIEEQISKLNESILTEESNERVATGANKRKEKAEKEAKEAKEKLILSIKIKLNEVNLGIDSKINDSIFILVKDIKRITKEFAGEVEHDALSGFEVRELALGFKVDSRKRF